MNMNLDDPKLTAYALDELDEPERSTIARAVAESPEAQQFVNETREMAGLLKSEFAADLEKARGRSGQRHRHLDDRKVFGRPRGRLARCRACRLCGHRRHRAWGVQVRRERRRNGPLGAGERRSLRPIQRPVAATATAKQTPFADIQMEESSASLRRRRRFHRWRPAPPACNRSLGKSKACAML